MLQRNQDLLSNAGTIVATTGVTSLFGFAYWIYAARFYEPSTVGYGSAAIATMMLIGTIGEFGIGTMLMGELPRGGNRGGLMTASLIACFAMSFVLGLGFAIVSISFGSHFAEINGTIIRILVFSFGVAITGVTLTFDEATIGLMRGGIQLRRNVIVSVAKMAVLPAFAFILHDHSGIGIMLSWVVGTLFSLFPIAVGIKRGGSRILYRPDWGTFWRLRHVTLAHNSLNLAVVTPGKLIPVVASLVVSPAAYGAYYIAMMINSFLSMIPNSLSMVLFAIAAAAPDKIGEKLRFVLRTSLYIGIPAGIAMGLSSHFVLSIFGSAYATLATGPLWILLVGYIPSLPSTVYIAVARATGQVNKAAIFFATFLAVQIVALVVGGKLDGLYGLSYAMLAVMIVQGLVTTPTVLRTAYGSVPVDLAAEPDIGGRIGVRSVASSEEIALRQKAGLAVLMSLATAGSVSRQPAATVPHAWRRSTEPPDGVGRGWYPRSAVPSVEARSYSTDTSWWPDANEAKFRERQAAGMAALIEIAVHAARLLSSASAQPSHATPPVTLPVSSCRGWAAGHIDPGRGCCSSAPNSVRSSGWASRTICRGYDSGAAFSSRRA